MMHQAKPQDHAITQKVSQRLASRGMRSPCRIGVVTSRGNVTLSGMIQYEHQRRSAVQLTRGVDGVQRVLERLRVIPTAPHRKLSSSPM
jgi:osmotically-inducible protein OsmY